MGPVPKLTAAVVVAVAGVLAVFASAGAWLERRVLEQAVARELAVAAHQVRATAAALTPLMETSRAAALASEGLEATFGTRWTWIRWPELRSPPPASVLALLDGDDRERLAAGEIVTVRRGGPRGELHILTPILAEKAGEAPLVLQLSASLDEARALSAAGGRSFWGLAGAAALATGLVTFGLGRVLVERPVARAAQALESAARVGAAVPIGGAGGELGRLLAAADALAARLREAVALAERRTLETQKTAEHLRRAERLASIGKLAAGIAHELGTPLNVIAARAKAIARSADDPAEVARLSGIVAQQTERMTTIVRQLLDFSRRRAPHLAQVSIPDIVRATIDLLEPQAKSAEVRVALEVLEPVPRTLADSAQIEQVVVNILLNAIQACPGGGDVTLRVERVRARPPADLAPEGDAGAHGPPAPPREVDAVRVLVIDTGVGIPRDHLPQLFDPFFTTKPPGQGTGLGLPVAWGIVREHGGWIEVESVEGEGTRVGVLLPIRGEGAA